jgi:hypothetical protein
MTNTRGAALLTRLDQSRKGGRGGRRFRSALTVAQAGAATASWFEIRMRSSTFSIAYASSNEADWETHLRA